MKVGFISLGCAKNLVDTEVMLGILKDHQLEITQEVEEAEIIIINTCAFITEAKEEAINTILNMAKYKEEGKCRILIVAGCLGQRYGNTLLEELPEVDAILGTGVWHRIMDAIETALLGKRTFIFEEEQAIYDAKVQRVLTTPTYSAYVKIAEGCNHRCAFCAIPLIRGKYKSRPIEDIILEVQKLAQSGVKEINLIAQDTTYYGYDLYGKASLTRLLKELVKIQGIQWIRFLYAYPENFSDELIALMAREEKICNYVDLPLQHAHDAVLKRMYRPDRIEDIKKLLQKIRQRIPKVAIRTTFIVGFPGETDEEFMTLKNFLAEEKFDRVGIFKYSREEDTPAYHMKGIISEAVMEERYHILMSLQSQISEDLNKKLEDEVFDVLVEAIDTKGENIAFGRSQREAPEVDGKIYIEGLKNTAVGTIIPVKILQGFTYDMVGKSLALAEKVV